MIRYYCVTGLSQAGEKDAPVEAELSGQLIAMEEALLMPGELMGNSA